LARPEVKAPMPGQGELEGLPLLDHLDLERVVVVAGFGEVGPWGSARTRWDMEKDGKLSLEGLAELAWTMGLVVPNEKGTGFLDGDTKEPVADHELHARYEEKVLAHAGVRVTEPETVGFDPEALVRLVEVHLEKDFAFPVPDRDTAEALRRQDPEHTEVRLEAGRLMVVRRRGAVVRVPSSLRVDRRVTGQVPKGFDPVRYGVPREMAEQVDPVTLYCLLSTAEAFLSAGLEPEEVYRWLHPSRVGVTVGTGIGGMKKLHRLHRDFLEGNERQNDTLQETLINVIGGYIVQSYLGSYGPMSFPVGACATGGLSICEGTERILSGAADMIVAGGADDLSEAGLVGFSDMGATASADEMEARGVEPKHMSRPSDGRRRGFVEAHGAGVALLCRASVALKMGLPVYGVVAYAGTFADGLQKSVPAPGQGALAAACEVPVEGRDPNDACGFAERRRRVRELSRKRDELARLLGAAETDTLLAAARREHGHDFYRDRDDIAPLRGALAVFGLTPDDVGVVSKHDSSTQANDENEARLHSSLARSLGRTPGNPLHVISQKALTGHPKGAAASWQVNGLLQAMAAGALPPNLSLDDVSPELAAFGELVVSDEPLEIGWRRMKAGLVTTLGFGHVSALLCLTHPFLFWRMLSGEERAAYEQKVTRRQADATHKLQAVVSGRRPLFTSRQERPFAGNYGEAAHGAHETRVLLDGRARLEGERYS
jgi:fatty acid synthase subunit beta, fungi type